MSATTAPYRNRAASRLRAWAVVRPLNAAIMALGTVVGALLATGADAFSSGNLPGLLSAAAATVSIGAAGNVVNDIFDVETDRINRPERPIPAGLLSVRSAWLTWAGLSVVGLLFAAGLSALHFAIAAASVLLLLSYSAQLKSRPLVGNLAVAVAVALSLPFGGLAVMSPASDRLSVVLAGAAFAFLTTLAREIVKDIEDVEGDSAQGARTLPIAAGVRPAVILATVITLVAVGALPLGVSAGLPTHFLPLALPAALLLLGAIWFSLAAMTTERGRQRRSARSASMMVKAGMLAGLIALSTAAW